MRTLRKRETPGQAVQRVMAGATYTTDPSRFAIATPWSSGDLQRIVAADVFGADRVALNTRGAAMGIPSVARGVNLVKSTIARFPLVGMVGDATQPDQAQRLLDVYPWLWGSGGGLSWQLRDAWTVDDLTFSGWSCWWRDNEAGGGIREVQRIDPADWTINDDSRIVVNGSPAGASDVILFPGLHEGILNYGRDALDDTRTLYRNVRARLLNPVPQLDLHQTGGTQLTDPEIDALIDRWALARQGSNAGVGYSSEHIDVRELGASDAALLIEARNAAAVDCARLIGVHAGLIDATAPKASLNYETTSGRNQEFVDFDLAVYMTPMTARLSMSDVMPDPRHFAAFELGDFTTLQPSPTGPTLEG